jgi:hypothetical protein
MKNYKVFALALMSHIGWVDELTCGDLCITTAESCFMLYTSITEGSGMTVIEELG